MTGRGNGILNSNFMFTSIITLIPSGLIVVLEIFFAGNTKKTKFLKLVSVHDRNKAWINKYRGSFLLKLL